MEWVIWVEQTLTAGGTEWKQSNEQAEVTLDAYGPQFQQQNIQTYMVKFIEKKNREGELELVHSLSKS